MNKRNDKEIIYFLCTHLTVNELLLGDLAGIDDTDRYRNSDIFSYNKFMHRRYTDIFIKESGYKRF